VSRAVAIVIALVVGLGVGGFVVYEYGSLFLPPRLPELPIPSTPQTKIRSPGNLVAVTAEGRLQPEGGVINVGATAGDRLSHYCEGIAEGKVVEKGQELAYLESHAIRVAQRDYAKAQLAEAEAQLKAVTTGGEASISEAKIRQKQVKDASEYDIAAQNAKIGLAKAQLANAKKNLERLLDVQRNNTSSTIPQQQIDQQRLVVRQAEEDLAASKALLDKLKVASESNRQLAQAQYESAQASLARAQSQIPIESLRKNVDMAEGNLQLTIVRAPSPGTILQILVRPGEVIGTQPILRMADTSRMVANAEVYEDFIPLVHVGQQAEISSRALPKKLTGKVISIGRIIARNQLNPLDPGKVQEGRVVEVKVLLDESADAARLINLQVTVEFARDSSTPPAQ
jgi:HlyD family secretion protein